MPQKYRGEHMGLQDVVPNAVLHLPQFHLAPLPMCSCPMAPTSTTRSSKTAGAGGTESMRQGIRH